MHASLEGCLKGCSRHQARAMCLHRASVNQTQCCRCRGPAEIDRCPRLALPALPALSRPALPVAAGMRRLRSAARCWERWPRRCSSKKWSNEAGHNCEGGRQLQQCAPCKGVQPPPSRGSGQASAAVQRPTRGCPPCCCTCI
jgi:hypothetical protein